MSELEAASAVGWLFQAWLVGLFIAAFVTVVGDAVYRRGLTRRGPF